MNSGVIQIGEWTFHASVFRLECGQKIIKLEPRVAKLLSCLVDNAGTPVSREALMEKVWPGTVVGDEALTNAINKLRKAFGDDRQNPHVIETIPKAGYRLIAHVEPAGTSVSHSDEFSENRPWLKKTIPAVLMVTLLVFVYVLWVIDSKDVARTTLDDDQISFSTKPSIAVLPFDNLSNDPEQEYFS
ncbi:MAG: hypothetical protein GQ572_10920, partial [Gammaproteobacteria bacterium]|nr:hypothetical protein [Gammaproteobacteria bacterium]